MSPAKQVLMQSCHSSAEGFAKSASTAVVVGYSVLVPLAQDKLVHRRLYNTCAGSRIVIVCTAHA